MATARSSTEFLRERYSLSSISHTIANAIVDSNSDLTNSHCYCTMAEMTARTPLTPHVLKLKALVDEAGGPAAFAEKYSRDTDKNAIDASYVSQILNGHRAFRDRSRKNMAVRAGLDPDYFEIFNAVQETAQSSYVEPAIGFMAADELEIIAIMREVDSEARRNIVGAARLAATEFRIRQQNSTQRAGQ